MFHMLKKKKKKKKKKNFIKKKKKKKSHFSKWAILGPKMAHPHKSGSTVKIFEKFYTLKGANR